MAECRLSLDEIIKLPLWSLHVSVAEDLDDEDDEDDEDAEKGDKGGEGAPAGGQGAETDPRIANLESEKQRFYDQRQKAREERDAAVAELAQLKKDGVQDEQAKQQLAELSTKLEKSDAVIATLSLENAFLKDNTHEWANPAAALKLADLSQVEIGEDGTVEGLRAALDALAKSDPYLLKPAKQDPPKPPRSGDRPASDDKQSAAQKRQTRDKNLKRKFPALRTH